MTTADIITIAIASLGVAATISASVAAWRAARTSKQVAEIELLSRFSERYGSQEMHDALREFGRLSDTPENIKAKAHNWKQQLEKGNPKSRELNNQRRLISKFYFDIYQLNRSGYIDDGLAWAAGGQSGVYLFLDVVERYEEAHNPGYERGPFDKFRELAKRYAGESGAQPARELKEMDDV